MPSGRNPGSTGLVWFRRDLRLGDNPAWAAATSAHQRVVALFVLDEAILRRAGPFRRAQLHAELGSLDASLRSVGGRLRVRLGMPGQIVPREAAGLRAAGVYWNADVTPYATARDGAVRSRLPAEPVISHGTLVLPPGSVQTKDGRVPRVFGAFNRAWTARAWDPWPEPGDATVADDPGDGLPAVEAPPPHPPGEGAAHLALETFLDGPVDRYRARRDQLRGDGGSGLSVALHFGTISARHVVALAGDRDDERRAFVRQLAWRDWFAHLLAETPDLVEHAQRPDHDRLPWRDAPDELAAWRDGRTGYPVVDAGMRQLTATGTMPNRVRMVAASFLVKDLLIDWRLGERHFRGLLLDGDVAQNVGNWQWVAGTGPDAAPYFRVFNPVAQSRAHDPTGAYLRRWLPELAGLDDHAIHAPWEVGPLELAAARVTLGVDYPRPMVDHRAARERALLAYRSVR